MKLLSPDHIARITGFLLEGSGRAPDFWVLVARLLAPCHSRALRALWAILSDLKGALGEHGSYPWTERELCAGGEALIAVVDALEREEAA